MSVDHPIPPGDLKSFATHNWSKIYELACKELAIQQEKRDKVINLYLLLCGFLVPLAGGSSELNDVSRGLIFLVAAFVGILFTSIIIRYRIYKEVHWITCSTITKMPNLKPAKVMKENVQAMFLDSMKLKAKKYLDNKELSFCRFLKGNSSSAETYSFCIVNLLASVMTGLGLFMLIGPCPPCWVVLGSSILAGLIVFAVFYIKYMRDLFRVYRCLRSDISDKERDDAFNSTFEKAWFLHVYYDPDAQDQSLLTDKAR